MGYRGFGGGGEQQILFEDDNKKSKGNSNGSNDAVLELFQEQRRSGLFR